MGRVQMAEGQGVRARAADADDRPLLPGEKKKLRREAIKAKRAARAARQGFDLAGVKEEFESMVADGTEMRTLGPVRRWQGAAGSSRDHEGALRSHVDTCVM